MKLVHCLCCFLVFQTVFLLGGVLLLVTGAQSKASADALTPETDFMKIQMKCTITNVAHTYQASEAQKSSSNKKGSSQEMHFSCQDNYVYSFSTTDSDGTYTSRGESLMRASGRGRKSMCMDYRRPVQGKFAQGQKVDCWKPTTNAVPDEYKCGSRDCYKIFDPAEEAAQATSSADTQLIFGGILMGGAFLCMCGAVTWFHMRCCGCGEGEEET